jgi:hypothetical protein
LQHAIAAALLQLFAEENNFSTQLPAVASRNLALVNQDSSGSLITMAMVSVNTIQKLAWMAISGTLKLKDASPIQTSLRNQMFLLIM